MQRSLHIGHLRIVTLDFSMQAALITIMTCFLVVVVVVVVVVGAAYRDTGFQCQNKDFKISRPTLFEK